MKIAHLDIERFKEDVYKHHKIKDKKGNLDRLLSMYDIDKTTFWRCVNGKTTVIMALHYHLCEVMGRSVNDYLK